jgi:microcystin degradation protein MlrC
MRIAIAALHHETNSFSNLPMTWNEMKSRRFEKETYIKVYTPIRNYSGGFIAKAKELGIELVPTVCAYLNPSGHITDEALENHRDGIVSLLWEAHSEAPLDAIALNLPKWSNGKINMMDFPAYPDKDMTVCLLR